ncbi:phage head-tail adaptor [Hyphomicrobium denitrificans 1NES1]|uniref:Phage head-tail adaptor n=1 Tax=Hyphomicrobium denitrificans 1NES1 TaxID=670307 RepID=N0BD87_9HYPH|nr:phage head closure protein [Hyphomicrobium denitrificans]AGK58095.1 phage head-tail adaptor [Hyphomicrobium denitrificans 1NES1]
MKAPVKAGDLRHRIVIERAQRTSDGAGGSTTEWETVAEVWAAIWSRSADENFTLDRTAGTATHDVWIRYRADVQPDMRIRFGVRIFDILGAIDVEDRGAWLKCPVEERDL